MFTSYYVLLLDGQRTVVQSRQLGTLEKLARQMRDAAEFAGCVIAIVAVKE